MIKVLHSLIRLTPAEWWSLFTAYRYLLSSGWRLFVRREKLDRWVMNGSGPSVKQTLTEAEWAAIGQVARRVDLASRYPLLWARCLQRSLALCLWMERQGLEPELKIGARKDGSDLKAHAWVECGGVVVNDRADVSTDFPILKPALQVDADPYPGQGKGEA